MKLFISYASEDHDVADQVQLALAAAGHEVFLDDQNLPKGGEYHSRIRTAILNSDAVVFLIGERSLDAGRYTLTELKFAREKWPHPQGHVFPVLLPGVSIRGVPNYLKAVTILEPQGSIAAEVLATVDREAGKPSPSASARRMWTHLRLRNLVACLAALVVGFGGLWYLLVWRGQDPTTRLVWADAARQLADSSPEVRITGADSVGELGSLTISDAQRALPVLEEALHRQAAIGIARPASQRHDVAAMVKGMSRVLAASDKNGWSLQRPQLTAVDLSSLDLSGLHLRGISVRDSLLEDAVLVDADLAGAKFTNVRLDRVKARRVDLSHVELRSACLEEARLEQAKLRGLKTFSSDLNGAVLVDAQLMGATFHNTRLKNAEFRGADLSSADLTGALEIVEDQFNQARSMSQARLPRPVYVVGTAAACAHRR